MRAVLLPIKSFRLAKERLASVLDAPSREQLARDLALRAVLAASATDAFVVCDDEEVREWAEALGATALWKAGLGLSGAVSAAVVDLGEAGIDHVVIAHADLPFVTDLGAFGEEGTITLCPDRRTDGTNVIVLSPNDTFEFAYGPGSYVRHLASARASGRPVRRVFDWDFACDVDTPADLALIERAGQVARHGDSLTPGLVQSCQ